MALDVYFRQDIANVARALGQNRGGGDFADGYRAALEDVATAFGCKPEPPLSISIVHADPVRHVLFERTLSCGHPKTALRYNHCVDCEAEHGDSAGNGG